MEYHKISIENLGPLKKIEKFEVKKINILIGESATGKSILAKAVYFFNYMFPKELEYTKEDSKENIESLLEQFFPYKQYKLTYYYTDKLSLEVELKNKKYTTKFSDDLIKEIKDLALKVKNSKKERLRTKEKMEEKEEKLKKDSDDLKKHIEKNREIEKVIEELIENNEETEETGKVINELKERIKKNEEKIKKYIDDSIEFLEKIEENNPFILRNKFYEKMDIISTIFIPATRSFVSDFDNMRLNKLNNHMFIGSVEDELGVGVGDITLAMFSELYRRSLGGFDKNDEKYKKLLKGNLSKDSLSGNLRLEVDNQTELSINQISSGQKEIVPLIIILQALKKQKKPHLLIVEEPESHLFPSDQRKVFDLLVEFANATNSKLMITTHSPYILMSADNLIKAKAKKYTKFKDKYIDFNEINASKLKNNKAESILDKKYKMVKTKDMEEVTDIIMKEYDKIIESSNE